MGGGLCSGWSTDEAHIPARPRASQTQPPYSVQALEVPAAYNGRVDMSHSGDQARVADLAATVTTIGLSHRAAIGDKVSSVVGPGRSVDRALPTDLSLLQFVSFDCHQVFGFSIWNAGARVVEAGLYLCSEPCVVGRFVESLLSVGHFVFVRYTALSIIAGKPGSRRDLRLSLNLFQPSDCRGFRQALPGDF